MKKLFFIKKYGIKDTSASVPTIEVDFSTIEKQLTKGAEIVPSSIHSKVEGNELVVWGEYTVETRPHYVDSMSL